METIKLPGIWLVVGSVGPNGQHPLLYSAKGTGNAGGGYQKIGSVSRTFYEVACAAAEAYNEQRNAEPAE